jgi:GGDEF domain-containing protein
MAVSAKRTMSMSYAAARALATVVGVLILGLLMLLLYARHVETAELVAVLLFLPIFFALLRWDVAGGAIAAILATVIYTSLRWSAIEQVGLGLFADTLSSRALGFLAFGLVGGWANHQLRLSIDKLDLYDEIDDETGLYNARFLLHDTDLEQARSRRYDNVFAVSVVEVAGSSFASLTRKKRQKTLRELGDVLAASVRAVDRAAHVRDGGDHWFAVVLPETGPEGARIFTEKLTDQVSSWLTTHGVPLEGPLTSRTICYPEDDEALERLRGSLQAIDRAEHPAHPTAAA